MELNKEKNFASAVAYLYDDEDRVIPFLEGLNATLSNNFLKYEIILVNDCSKDRSTEIVKNWVGKQEKSCVTLLNMSFHQGVETAMNAGVDLSIGDFVFEFDSVCVDYKWSLLMDVYYSSLAGYDIVTAHSVRPQRFTSKLFYSLMNHYAHLEYQLEPETFRILSRRAINRVHDISETIPYRKAAYANCGLKLATKSYQPVENIKFKVPSGRVNLALNSLILFTDVAFRTAVGISFLMVLVTIFVAIYALSYYLFEHPVEGWTTTILFLSFSFCCLFIILAMILKYLSTLVKMNFLKKTYIFETIEKLQ